MADRFRRRALNWTALQAERTAGALSRRTYIALEYPPSADNSPRWGQGKPPHPELDALFASLSLAPALDMIAGYRDDLARIANSDDIAPTEPRWNPGNLPGLDGAAIYGFIRSRAPKRYLEIGSGNSTKFAGRAVRDGGLSTELISIDPHPRAAIDELCDRVIRAPLETADLSLFGELQPGDVVFFDGSHRLFMNSDVAVFFLEVIPRLPPGVLFGIHDIVLPADYAPGNAPRFWNEQHVLAAFLLGG